MTRVLHVIGAMDRGGAETMIMNLYRSIDRDKLQFDFLVHEERECDYDAEIGRLGGKIYRLPRFTGSNLVKYRSLCRRFFDEHPEYPIVHGHIGSSAAIYLSAAREAGRRAVAHSHSQNYTKGLGGLAFGIASYPTRFVADWFFACSEEAGIARFGSLVVRGERFAVLDNGIDLERYRCDESSHRAAKESFGLERRPVFGHVGRFDPVKNHGFLLEAFALLLHRLPDAVLLLAGRGDLEEDLRKKARNLGIGDAVRFLGVTDDVPSLLRALDVFVFPSVNEGLPVATVEAQASGAQCLISDGVPKRAFISEDTVRLPLDAGSEAWASEMWRLYERSKEGGRVDRVDEARACGFDVVQTAVRLQRFYGRLADEGRRARF